MAECVIAEKTCTQCGVTKALSEFYTFKSHGGWSTPRCKSCMREADLARKYRDPEKHRGAFRAYYRRNRGQSVARVAAWEREHPEHVRVTRSNVRARRTGTAGRVTLGQWKEILIFYGHACAQCKVSGSQQPLTIDHFVPIAKGGVNDWRNVWPLCLPCNLKKSDTMPAAGAPPHVAALAQTGT